LSKEDKSEHLANQKLRKVQSSFATSDSGMLESRTLAKM
jgi:hypothetical protein